LIVSLILHPTFVLNNGARFNTGYEHVHLFVNNFSSPFKSHFMGRVKKGILGGFSGKVGTVVGGKWRGKEFMRSLPTRSKNSKKSMLLLQAQAKFALATQFAQGMKDLLDLGFSKYAKGKTGLNSAVAFILKNAITGTYPDYQIVYDQLLVSRGSLLNAFDGKAAAGAQETIQFTWTNNAGPANAKATDQVLLAAYCPAFKCSVYKIGAARNAGTDTLFMPGFSGQLVHTWMSFISADQSDIASSVYRGEITIV
jgi:hypothetical protein